MATTGNPIRDVRIREAIQSTRDSGEPVTFENLKRRLPDDFRLRPSEVSEFKAADVVDAEFIQAAEPVAAEPAELVKPLAEQIADAEAALVEAEQKLADVRTAVILCRRRVTTTRAAAARAITQFQSGLMPYRPADLIRDHLASEQEHRRKVAAGEVPARQRPRALSVVDAVGQSRPDSANQRYGRQFARGGYPASAYGQKVPSER